MTEQQAKQLEYPFQANEIKWRVASKTQDNKKGLAVPYMDSRAVQARLNAVLGRENWENRFQTVTGTGKDASYICEISIYYPEQDRWITKSNGAGSTDVEPVKGGLSDAFKRAASMWGVGSYLYGFTGVWVTLKPQGRSFVIHDSETDKLNSAYNRMVNQYLMGQQGTPRQTAAPASQPKSPAQRQSTAQQAAPAPAAQQQAYANQQQPVRQTAQTGQQPRQTAPAPAAAGRQAPIRMFRVLDAKTTKGGSGAQTYVSLQGNDGSAITGYIKGDGVRTGQTLTHLQVIPQHDEVVGDYNVISSYKVAA